MSPVVVLAFLASTLVCATLGQLSLSAQQAQALVDAHNAKRVLPFKDGSYGGNTRRLNWDAATAALAQAWADQMCVNNNMEHDKYEDRCITIAGEKLCGFGQNLASGSQSEDVDITAVLNQSFDLWYAEVELSKSEDLNPFRFDYNTGHYTQVIWANTSRIGCGACTLPKDANGLYTWMVACDYYPAGNFQGENTYKPSSAPGTDCPEGTTADSQGLCDGPFTFPVPTN